MIAVLLAGISALTACSFFSQSPLSSFWVKVSPDSGHPPFEVTITATAMVGGQYTFDLPSGTVEQESNTLNAVVDRDPWEVRVLWSDGRDDPLEATCSVNVLNRGPKIRRPRLAPYADWYLHPRERTLLDFNYYAGSMYGEATGIDDPEGDAWRVVNVVVRCEEKSIDDSIFCPPYAPDDPTTFHAFWEGSIIENACVVYPTYTGEPSPLLPPTTTEFRSDRIEFVEPFHYDAAGDDHENLNDEYFTLRNTGITRVNMTAWLVSDKLGHVFEFPAGFSLSLGACVTIHTGSGTNTASELYWECETSIWNNDSDTAILRNSSGEVEHAYVYPGLPYSPSGKDSGYPFSGTGRHNLTPGDMPSQTATITVIVEDEWGARATESFQIDVAPVGYK